MSIFDRVFGEHINSIAFYHINGMTRVDERDDVLSFKITPTYMADYVEIAAIKNNDNAFDITLFKRSEPYRYFKAVDRENVVEILEKGTDAIFS